jgi:thiopeptide-type bacteriocin biosynthesis protein
MAMSSPGPSVPADSTDPTVPAVSYEPAGFFLLRAPALTAGVFADLTALTASGPPERAWAALRETSRRPEVERALLVASEDLQQGLKRMRDQPIAPDRRLRRAYSSVFRYVTRMTTRATPFGLFSAVAVGTFGPRTTARLGGSALARFRTRTDMGWLLALIRSIEEDPDMVPELRVLANATAYRAGERIVLPDAEGAGEGAGEGDIRTVALRATPVVTFALDRARTPIPYRDLAAELLRAFPGATGEQVEGLLRRLWELEYLTSDLRPPLTDPHPERHLLRALPDVSAAKEITATLRRIADLTAAVDRSAPGETSERLRELAAVQRSLVPGHTRQPYQVDAALDLAGAELSEEVGAAAAEAAACLSRLGDGSTAYPHLASYHAIFLERYGPDVRVPLLELLSPEVGLGAPPTYRGPARGEPASAPWAGERAARDAALVALHAEALRDLREGALEVELTDERLERLAGSGPTPSQAPAIDVYLQLQAESAAAIDRGDWRVVLHPGAVARGGRPYGRFFDLISTEAIERLRDYTRREEELFEDVVFADLNYLPQSGRDANVAGHPPLRRYEIPVNVASSVPADHRIPLDDILVTATREGFVLRSARLGREILATQGHMLNPQAAPNPCRFLLEVSADRARMPRSVHWGPLESAPFLPRLVRGRVVLRCAQWNLDRRTFADAAARSDGSADGSDDGFAQALRSWRESWRVPRHVYLVQADHRLLLDLDHPLSRQELRARLNGTGDHVELHEALPGLDGLWLRDAHDRPYVSELVVPLVLREPPAVTRSSPPAGPGPGHALGRLGRRQLPGGAWVHLKLYVTSGRHDEIISGRLRPLASSLEQAGLFDRWFFIRYTDPDPHLRIRFRAAQPQAAGRLLADALAWSRDLIRRGLATDVTVGSYDREIERYGGPDAIDAAELVFAANSTVAAELLAGMDEGTITLDPRVVAIFGLDTLYRQWGLDDLDERMRWLPHVADSDAGRQEFRRLRATLCELIQPYAPRPDPGLTATRVALERILDRQAPAVRDMADLTTRLDTEKRLWAPATSILGSLAHMFINRTLGMDRDQEHRCYLLWRRALGAIRTRPPSVTQPSTPPG